MGEDPVPAVTVSQKLAALIMALCLIGCGKKPDEATQMVIDEITAITEADHYDVDAINTAYERYNTLTDSQKEMVTNYADLLKAQDGLNRCIVIYYL